MGRYVASTRASTWQVLGRSVTTGRQKFNKRQSGSLHVLGEGLSILLIRADETI